MNIFVKYIIGGVLAIGLFLVFLEINSRYLLPWLLKKNAEIGVKLDEKRKERK